MRKRLSAFQDLSPKRDLSFVANNPVVENARSASTDIGGMLDNALNSCSNLLGLFPVASNTVIKDGSTVRSEFAYCVPHTLNRTVLHFNF